MAQQEITEAAEAEVIDSEVIETQDRALVRIEPKDFTDAIARFDAEIDAQAGFAERYDKACRALIGANDVQKEGDREFKKKSAWRKLQRAFHISTQIIEAKTWWETDEDGERHCVSRVTVRAVAPWGQYSEAIGKCSTRESRFMTMYPTCPQCGSAMWDNRNDDRGDDHFNCKKCKHKLHDGDYDSELIGTRVPSATARMKADHDCEATAETRATNRATSNLIAAGEVSAEEIEGGEPYANSNNSSQSTEAKTLDSPIGFGQNKELTFRQVCENDRNYAHFLENAELTPDHLRSQITELLAELKDTPDSSGDGTIDEQLKSDLSSMWNDFCKEVGLTGRTKEIKDKKLNLFLQYVEHCIPTALLGDIDSMSQLEAEKMLEILTKEADAALAWLKKQVE